MEWRLFFSTFALIFLAELGDKTQLASMAASAGTRSPWSVFAGASFALVMSTLVAVLVGSTLNRFIPQFYIKSVAAIIFLVFGVILLVNAFQVRAEKPASIAAPAPHGLLARAALRAAAEFERGAAEDYVRLARETESAILKSLFSHLAEEEKGHLARVLNISQSRKTEQVYKKIQTAPAGTTGAETENSVAGILETVIRHEKSTADFYKALADSSNIPEIRDIFSALAAEERSHVAHLEEFRNTGTTDISKNH